ncbi:LytR/AlgR family response regulator transcription factor [Flavilitoribacter nigricans]|uniref:DNA-binding response regulator n=1 Tax=Flavilitoribacter nigricans (strain ATCC 23147 / DSM 23189 / NBRC 102662 / NCIMB 1420 / SS-2) TaxID=1122177 RepID=A0A2D0NAN9_FLAN2|nr:LytTR family transcriptional regulator DNA-binding domain-containing protein [Flavilitoribacter nigricans]PHN05581.1 DNA-binding response regulator [Flavilitoribacter nigricans DSM 23189 = NBRC 102662]
MLNCLIIDDEPLAIRLLSDYIDKTEGLSLLQSFTDPIEALQFAERQTPDLIFLDIQMPELTGIQFMKIANGKYPIILTTAYDHYALDSYEFDVIDYLLKPISLDRFMIAAGKAKKRLLSGGTEHSAAVPATAAPTQDYIFVKSDYKTLKIDLADIYYLEGLGDYVAIHLKEKKILTLENMKHFEATLPGQNFIRVHKSYLVALDKISFIERNRIVIKEQRLPIGATYKDAFWAKIGN